MSSLQKLLQNDFTKTFPTLTEASSTKILKIYLILYKELLLPLYVMHMVYQYQMR